VCYLDDASTQAEFEILVYVQPNPKKQHQVRHAKSDSALLKLWALFYI